VDWKAAQRQNWREELARERVDERLQKRRHERGGGGRGRGEYAKRRRYDEYGEPRGNPAEADYYYDHRDTRRERSYDKHHREEGYYDSGRRRDVAEFDYDSGRRFGHVEEDDSGRRREYARHWDSRYVVDVYNT
jgi:hypothetical protein